MVGLSGHGYASCCPLKWLHLHFYIETLTVLLAAVHHISIIDLNLTTSVLVLSMVLLHWSKRLDPSLICLSLVHILFFELLPFGLLCNRLQLCAGRLSYISTCHVSSTHFICRYSHTCIYHTKHISLFPSLMKRFTFETATNASFLLAYLMHSPRALEGLASSS